MVSLWTMWKKSVTNQATLCYSVLLEGGLAVDKNVQKKVSPVEKTESDYIVVPLNSVLRIIGDLCPDCMHRTRQRIAAEQINLQKDRDRRIGTILESVAEQTGIVVTRIIGRENTQRVVEARRLVSIQARQLGYSYPRIGAALNKHHTTIIHLVRTYHAPNQKS